MMDSLLSDQDVGIPDSSGGTITPAPLPSSASYSGPQGSVGILPSDMQSPPFLSDEDVGIGTSQNQTAQQISSMPSAESNALAVARGVGNAIPFYEDIGALAETGASYLPQSVRQYIPAVSDQDQNQPFSQRFSDYRQQQSDIDTTLQAQHPAPFYGSEVAGAFGLPIGGAEALASKLPGVIPGAVRGAIGTGAVGAGYGALYGAGNANSLPGALSGAETGAVLGGAAGGVAPSIIGGIGNIGSRIVNPFRGAINPSGIAANRIGDALSRDAGSPGLSSLDVLAARGANQPIALADLGGQTTQALARSAANLSPEARAALSEVANERYESQASRFQDFVQNLFGNDLNNQTVRDNLATQAKSANAPAYQAAYAQGANGVWNDDLANLLRDPNMASAVQDAQTKAAHNAVMTNQPIVKNPFTTDPNGNISLATADDGSTAYPTLQYWDQVKRSLDGKIGVAQRSGDKEHAADLIQLKSALVGNLDRAVPAYAAARQGAFRAFGAENALEAGENFLGLTNSLAINEMKKSLENMTPIQRKLFAQGLAAQIAQKAANPSVRRNIVNLFNSPQTVEKMQLGLGADKAKQIDAYLRRESIMDRLRTALGNSTTARQQIEAGMAEGHEEHGMMGMIGHALGSPLGAAFSAGVGAHEMGASHAHVAMSAAGGFIAGLLGKFVKGTQEKVVRNIGEMLASDDPKVVAKVTQRIARNPDLLRALKKAEIYTVLSGTNIGTQGLDNRALLPATQ